jgi:hypothetical protein
MEQSHHNLIGTPNLAPVREYPAAAALKPRPEQNSQPRCWGTTLAPSDRGRHVEANSRG